MMKCLVIGLLLAICVAFVGCTNVEPTVQTRAPAAVEPAKEASEPNGVTPPQATEQAVEEPAPAVAEAKPAEVLPEPPANEARPVEVNEPVKAEATPDANAPAATEPNAVAAVPEVAKESPKDEALSPTAEASSPLPTSNCPLETSFYAPYAEILAAYVRENGLVDYGALRHRRLELKAILSQLDELDPNIYDRWSRQEKLAFWIDAYNLKMLDIVARNYPIESSWWLRLTWPPSDIRHIKGLWTDYKFLVMDEEFTPAEVEQRFFRQTFDDPRVWLALTYVCQSSPPLRGEPYRGEGMGESVKAGKRGSGRTEYRPPASTLTRFDASTLPLQSSLDQQLDEQVRRFLSSPQGLQIDRRDMVVRLSALFKPNWRGKEFVARYGTDKKFKGRDPETRAVLNFLTNYLSRDDVEFLEVENYSLEYLNFDWRLNDTDKGY